MSRAVKNRIGASGLIFLGLAMIMAVMHPRLAGYGKMMVLPGCGCVMLGILVIGATR